MMKHRTKVAAATGLAVGYVLGARAGRERYEQLKGFATQIWNDERVQDAVDRAGDAVDDMSSNLMEGS